MIKKHKRITAKLSNSHLIRGKINKKKVFGLNEIF